VFEFKIVRLALARFPLPTRWFFGGSALRCGLSGVLKMLADKIGKLALEFLRREWCV
jgi:hypothetical protein